MSTATAVVLIEHVRDLQAARAERDMYQRMVHASLDLVNQRTRERDRARETVERLIDENRALRISILERVAA